MTEELRASCALVNLRLCLKMPPTADARAIAERAVEEVENLRLQVAALRERNELDRLYLEAYRERLVSWMLR